MNAAQKTLLESCDKVRDLYYFMLNISGPLVRVAEEKIAAGLRKFHPTEAEANPNYKFVRNRFAALLSDDPEFGSICAKRGLGWGEYEPFVRHVYNSMITKDYYRDYMASEEDSFEADCRLFSCIFQDEFEDNEELESILEDLSLLWIDDLAFALNAVIAGIDETARKKRIVHPNTFLKEDDKEFALRLLSESIVRYDEYFKLLEEHLDNWKSDRLVSTDAALIVMGITEAVVFPTIPVKVTINEYVEIAKYYSTPNSRIFVNGILDRIIQEKIREGEIVKQGRGLFEQ
ncbi:MAG: transcription antitermination factor NusB [Bacteroidales bacterium]|nr:transcription antitermination factor NusB [Bacteroidales bacterium]MBQ1708385.1 transcription antitermination factor NusB [Bacteroidales bacterium]